MFTQKPVKFETLVKNEEAVLEMIYPENTLVLDGVVQDKSQGLNRRILDFSIFIKEPPFGW